MVLWDLCIHGLILFGFNSVGSDQWVQFSGFNSVGSDQWVQSIGFKSVGSVQWVQSIGFKSVGSNWLGSNEFGFKSVLGSNQWVQISWVQISLGSYQWVQISGFKSMWFKSMGTQDHRQPRPAEH